MAPSFLRSAQLAGGNFGSQKVTGSSPVGSMTED